MAELVTIDELRRQRRALAIVERSIVASVACNNPDNGLFDGRARFVHFEIPKGELLEFDHDDWERGARFKVSNGAIEIGGETFRVFSWREWVGNWCWNAYRLTRAEGIRLMRHLHQHPDWKCTGGTVRVVAWLERAKSPPTEGR